MVRVSNATGSERKRGSLAFMVIIDDLDICRRMLEEARSRRISCPELVARVVKAVFEQAGGSSLVDAVLDDASS